MIILSVDPGTTTGFAHLDTTDDASVAPVAGQLGYEQFQMMVADNYADDEVQMVIERFVLNAGSIRKSREGMHHAIQTIGVLEFLARQNDWPKPKYQLPADVMRMVDNKSLRALGWYARGQEHANDALRHIAVWSLKQGRIRRKDLHPNERIAEAE